MSDRKLIDKVLTPDLGRGEKRPRPSSSPEADSDSCVVMSGEKVGELTQGQLMDSLSKLLDLKLSELCLNLASKKDFEHLSGQVSVLVEENSALKEEVSVLRVQGQAVSAKLLDLESRSRRNNLIFKGLKWSKHTRDFRLVVSNFCADYFGSDNRLWINRAHPLGKGRDAIIAHIPSDSDIDYIMSRTHMLKDKGFVVHRDYPQEVREKRACLVAVRAEVERVVGRRRMPLAFDHLNVEGTRFTWENNKLMAGQEDGGVKLRTILQHDFGGFLGGLSQNGPRRMRRNPSTSNVDETTDETPDGSSQPSGTH